MMIRIQLMLAVLFTSLNSEADQRRTRQVPVYKDVPVYREKCDYDTYEWQSSRSVHFDETPKTTPGQGLPTPELGQLSNLERANLRAEFKAKVEYNTGKAVKSEWTHIDSEQEFQKLSIGQKVKVRISNWGKRLLSIKLP